MIDSGVYEIRNTVTGCVYIGCTRSARHRFNLHRIALRHGRHSNRFLQADWNAYGEAAFTMRLIEQMSGAESFDRHMMEAEERHIATAREEGGVYNIGWDRNMRKPRTQNYWPRHNPVA